MLRPCLHSDGWNAGRAFFCSCRPSIILTHAGPAPAPLFIHGSARRMVKGQLRTEPGRPVQLWSRSDTCEQLLDRAKIGGVMGGAIPCASSFQGRNDERHHFGAVRPKTSHRTYQQAANPAERNESNTKVPGRRPCGDEVHRNREKEGCVQPAQVYPQEDHDLRASLSRRVGTRRTSQTERADASLDRRGEGHEEHQDD